MKVLLSCLLVCCILFYSCTPKPSTKPAEGFGTARATDLEIKPAVTEMNAEWGVASRTTIDVNWKGGQKYPVQVVPASGSPDWLMLETKPMILEPPGQMELNLTAAVGRASLGTHRLTFEATAYGLSQPVTFDLDVTVTRQNGGFFRLLPSHQTVECRNICGKLNGNQLTFYDLLKEKLQTCGEDPLPDNQKIGFRSFGVGQKGWGFAAGCAVAGIYESAGSLSLVNTGFFDIPVKRGDVFFSVRDADDCWLSPDNTLAIIRSGGSYAPYDVLTGQLKGNGCRSRMEVGRATLQGSKLEAGDCVWELSGY